MNTNELNKKVNYEGYGEITAEMYRLLQFRGREPEMSYFKNFDKRLGKAEEQFREANNQLDKLEYKGSEDYFIKSVLAETIKYLEGLSVKTSDALSSSYDIKESDILETKNVSMKQKYKTMITDYSLNNVAHIVWMKFAKDKESGKKYLGVVAASNDINFSMNNTSGKIIGELGLEWDESFVLIFPLSRITDGMRKDIECGIGNHLIEKGIPILDFYSHRFQ